MRPFAPREQAAQGGGDAEVVGLIDHVLGEVGSVQVGERHRAGALQLVVHGLKQGVWRRGLGSQNPTRHDGRADYGCRHKG